MKIDINRIPAEGQVLTEEFSPQKLDLDTEILKFRSPVSVRAEVTKIINAVCVHLILSAQASTCCSRCLQDFDIDFKKSLDLNFPVDKSMTAIDLDPEIRDELILDYPVKPLCKADCLGLCVKCGENLNIGGCSCGTTKKKAF